MGVRLGTLLLAIFFICLLLVASIFHYHNKFKNKYSIKNYFPYELNYNSHVLDNGWGNLSLAFMSASLIAFFVTFDSTYFQTFLLPINIVGAVFSLLLIFIVLVPIMKLRIHIALVIAEFVLSVALPSTIAIAAFRIIQIDRSSIPALISLIGSGITALFSVILVFNPGISLQIKMDERYNANGEKEYVRPHSIPLAYTEWLLFFTVFIDAIMAFILMLSFGA